MPTVAKLAAIIVAGRWSASRCWRWFAGSSPCWVKYSLEWHVAGGAAVSFRIWRYRASCWNWLGLTLLTIVAAGLRLFTAVTLARLRIEADVPRAPPTTWPCCEARGAPWVPRPDPWMSILRQTSPRLPRYFPAEGGVRARAATALPSGNRFGTR